MKIAIIIFLILSILGYGSLKIGDIKISVNWFAIVAFILFLIYIH